MSTGSEPQPRPFDPDDWRRRYHAAHHESYRRLEAMDAARRDELLERPRESLSEAEADEFARLQEEYAAVLAPREALLEEWAAAHPGHTYGPARDPNKPPFFPPGLTAVIRFVRCDPKVACARCGKKRKRHWTMIVPFKAGILATFTIDTGDQVFYPLTPVCDDHPLAPAPLPEEPPS